MAATALIRTGQHFWAKNDAENFGKSLGQRASRLAIWMFFERDGQKVRPVIVIKCFRKGPPLDMCNTGNGHTWICWLKTILSYRSHKTHARYSLGAFFIPKFNKALQPISFLFPWQRITQGKQQHFISKLLDQIFTLEDKDKKKDLICWRTFLFFLIYNCSHK